MQGVTTIGSANADMLEGTPQEDYLIGKDGDDTFVADAGNDGINGGVGLDRLMLQGDLRDYAISVEGGGYRIVGPEGRDFIINVEELVFDNTQRIVLADQTRNADGTLTLDYQ